MCKAALALLMVVLLCLGGAAAEEMPLLQVHQINAGCADCYLLLCGDTALMIDCGTDQEHTKVAMLDYLDKAGFDKLDACIITHYHKDHVGNINTVLGLHGDENTIVYGPHTNLPMEFLPLAAGHYRQMVNGDEITLGGMHIKCVGPKKINGMGRINKDSLNMVLTYGERRFFFTGDYVRSKDVGEEYQDILKDMDVLKFPHHGIQPWCIEPWLVKVLDPEIVLVPAAYGWSARDLMVKNGMRDALVLDIGKGHIVITTDGQRLDAHTHVEPGQFAQ